MARTENLTIMFTDVVGYTQRTSTGSRSQLRDLLKRCSRILLPLINRYGGWQVKNLGDALLIAFRSPTDALRCGMAQHDAIAASNRGLPPEEHLHIRIAVTLGEVLVEDSDVFGEAVNLAARIENITPPDHLYFSEAVYLAMNKAEVPSQLVGTEEFKGIPEPVRIFQVPVRQVARLVPAGEPLSSPEPELPFGGTHLLAVDVGLRSRLRGRLQEIRLQAGQAGQKITTTATHRPQRALVAVLLLVLAGLSLSLWPRFMSFEIGAGTDTGDALATASGDRQLLAQAQPLLQAGRYEDVRVLYAARLASNPQDPEALILQGHDLFRRNQRKEGVAAYEKALSSDASLQNDPLLAQNLALGLSWASDEAIPLIRRYVTPTLIDALARRTSEPDAPRARVRAASLLTELGFASRIDRGGMALQDLREAEDCDAKLSAVRRLRAAHEKRALPDLQALMGGGLGGWWSNRCVRDEAEAAIREIRK